METYLFYAYLKYAKKNELTFLPKLFSLPRWAIVFFVLTIIACLGGAIFTLIGSYILSLLSLALEIIFGAIFYYLYEKYQVNYSDYEYENYKEHCLTLMNWLKEFEVEIDDIRDIYDSIGNKIEQLKAEEDKANSSVERWLNALIIPTIIAIIAGVIDKQDDIANMITYPITIVILFAVAYGLISVVRKMIHFPEKRKIEQMECFSNDLRGIMFFTKEK